VIELRIHTGGHGGDISEKRHPLSVFLDVLSWNSEIYLAARKQVDAAGCIILSKIMLKKPSLSSI